MLPFAVFVVPQGREHDWSFHNEEGMLSIAQGNRIERLVVVTMCRAETYGTMQTVQDELAGTMLELAAPSLLPAGYQIPYMGVGDNDLGLRCIRYRGLSPQGRRVRSRGCGRGCTRRR